ncbi:MAG: sugar ABC transporter substrate-binding protein [Lachnospiraceae bacterium]|nr:sugar ABC transporter substrate-binding protein [Lachnospiraceae bacterium]
MKKRIVAVMMAAAMALSMAACGSSASDSTSSEAASSAAESASSTGEAAEAGEENEDVKISLVFKTLASEHWQLMKAGAEAWADEHPEATVDIVGPPSETSYDEQLNMIETTRNSDYDAYVIAPLQSDQVATAIAGETRPVIAVDTAIDAPEVIGFVGTGNEEAAKMGAIEAVQAAKDAGWEEIKCIEIAGVQGDQTNTARMNGYKAGINEAGGEFLEDEVQYAEAVADKAVLCMEAIMQKFPEGIAIICANNDDMAVAAAKVAAESGNENYANTIFLGFDGSTAACEAVLDGRLTLTCAQQPYEMGYLACQAAYEAANGQEIDEVIDSGTEIINTANAQERLDTVNGYIEG